MDKQIGQISARVNQLQRLPLPGTLAGEITELQGFGLTASNLEPGRPFDLEGGFSVNLAQSQLVGDVKFSGQIKSAADGTRYGVDDFDLSFKGTQVATRKVWLWIWQSRHMQISV